MSVKPWAVFVADFPDDMVEDERDILTFGGRNVAVAIGGILARLGCEVSAPMYSGELGWEFGAWFKGRRAWCLISSFHPTFFLHFDDPPAFWSRGKDAPAYEEIAQKSASPWRKIRGSTTSSGTRAGGPARSDLRPGFERAN